VEIIVPIALLDIGSRSLLLEATFVRNAIDEGSEQKEYVIDKL
jgi:hypothetical protein